MLCTRLDPIDGWLLAVADGIGGHQAGDIASETAVEMFQDYVGSEGEIGYERDLRPVLGAGIKVANAELRSLAAADSALRDMGTTLVAALATDEGFRSPTSATAVRISLVTGSTR